MGVALDPVLIGGCLGAIYKTWCSTLRYDVEGFDDVRGLLEAGRRIVYVLWHDELFAISYFGYAEKLHLVTVVSQSKDGEFLAQILKRLGLATARGSSRRGGLAALRAARRIMQEEGRHAVLTIDGPKGPRHKAKEGAVYLAAKAGAVIVPIRCTLGRKHVFEKAWDRFQLPMPFTRARLVFGPAYELGAEPLAAENLPGELARMEQALESLV